MANHAIRGYCLSKASKFYIDQSVSNGPVKVTQAADPKKLEELKSKNKYGISQSKRLTNFVWTPISKNDLKSMKNYIIK